MSDQPGLFDPPAQRHSPTSRAAAERITPAQKTIQRKVYELIAANGDDGITDEDIALRLGLNPSTARPRRVELEKQGKIKDSGRTRSTLSGRAAVVWVAV